VADAASDDEIVLHLDGLVGPTHGYGGLARGNLASQAHRGEPSNPREAVLEGIAKMRLVAALGVPQGVLPPQERPLVSLLRAAGLEGDDADVLARAAREMPALLETVTSASSMWAANAATISPAADTADGAVHVTPANLASSPHRAIESPATSRALAKLLPESAGFVHHVALPPHLRDEGAANHLRLRAPGEAGVEAFVFGRDGDAQDAPAPRRFPARQLRAASESIARAHTLDPARTLFLQQHPEAFDAGAFHDDVVAVAEGTTLLAHERAFLDPDATAKIDAALSGKLVAYVVPEAELSLDLAVRTYLFNSQLVPTEEGLVLIAPSETRAEPAAAAVVDRLMSEPGATIVSVRYVDVRQSMKNGGGPACLRLRVPIASSVLPKLHRACRLDDAAFDALEAWARDHYRDRLVADDLADPAVLDESRRALDALTRLLDLGSDFYAFQRA
jgi:succinylarginine dihydrolase